MGRVRLQACASTSFTRAQIPDCAEFASLDWSAARMPNAVSRSDRLRGEFVFVQQPAEPVATAEAIELQRL